MVFEKIFQNQSMGTEDNNMENKCEFWWWKDLRKVCGKGKNENQIDNNISWSKGKGNKILF